MCVCVREKGKSECVRGHGDWDSKVWTRGSTLRVACTRPTYSNDILEICSFTCHDWNLVVRHFFFHNFFFRTHTTWDEMVTVIKANGVSRLQGSSIHE